MSQAPVWQARTQSGLDGDFEAFSQCVEDDLAYLKHDLAGSIAHVAGLHKVGLLSGCDAGVLVAGLQEIGAQLDGGDFVLDPSLEDGHMNLEAALTQQIGEAAKRLHTGRSRNDQVATCIVLRARQGLLELASGAHHAAQALLHQAQQHTQTPWTATTHGRPAQPATVGFLLTAHAARLQDVAKQALQVFDDIGESPLGSGAVAGSTLPLDPVYTANLLGLRPVRNALLATGARDVVIKTLWPAVVAGQAAASLAQELVGLFEQGAFTLPAGFTTGSSLMPHKRNPDALELVRGKGQSIQGQLGSALSVTGGNALGYLREYQLTKPLMDGGLTDATSCLKLLCKIVEGGQFTGSHATDSGLIATDLAEALVAQGMPFRTAYAAIAAAWAAHEAGAKLTDALLLHVPSEHLEPLLAIVALPGDACRRITHGGPAPACVEEAISALGGTSQAIVAGLEAAQSATEHAAGLLHGDFPQFNEADA